MGTLSWGLDLAAFDNAPVRLHGFELRDVTMLQSDAVQYILGQIKVGGNP